MYVNVIFLAIIIQLPYIIYSTGSCSPNTQFIINGFLCLCNHEGHWNEASCKMIGRRSQCVSGEVVRRGCTQCVCHNGNFKCDNSLCFDEVTTLPILQKLSYFGLTCTPFRSYYVNCSLCICPASGQTSEAQCVVDVSCPLLSHSLDTLRSTAQNQCFPNIMYLFPCLQCLCSESGTFTHEKCTEKCYKPTVKPTRRCIPGTIYRVNCNICRCPENSIPDGKLCEQVKCNNKTLRPIIRTLRIRTTSCTPHVFTKPKCLYCDCKPEGVINENSCIEMDCFKASKLQQEISNEACSPGELMPLCVECFCLRNRSVRSEYCTRSCSNQNKLEVLEKLLNNSIAGLIDEDQITKDKENNKCVPNSLYLDEGRYCLCPKRADASLKACTLYYKYTNTPAPNHNKVEIDFNRACKPSTLVEFGCNICFCSKNGKISPKWCTSDDCEAKKIIQESHKSHPRNKPFDELTHSCMPGSISTVKCNFCICPESGIFGDRVCTKNECDKEQVISHQRFTCEPLAYYEVDCNICVCPPDGLKNVAKCTKNSCDTNFLRSNYCVPGHLFIDGCNICVCPTNGKKEDKACTNHICDVKTWKLLKLPQTLLSEIKVKRNLDVCFPGEEFIEGCKLCVCAEEGLKAYAICEAVMCTGTGTHKNNTARNMEDFQDNPSISGTTHIRERRDLMNRCPKYNVTIERKDCTPGTMYIIRCKQCFCPYAGSIYDFCRPLPENVHCEQRFPGFNFDLPFERRVAQSATLSPSRHDQTDMKVTHKHTKYACGQSGKIMDKCFICECEEKFLIEEHCFKSNNQDCLNATPSFFEINKITKTENKTIKV